MKKLILIAIMFLNSSISGMVIPTDEANQKVTSQNAISLTQSLKTSPFLITNLLPPSQLPNLPVTFKCKDKQLTASLKKLIYLEYFRDTVNLPITTNNWIESCEGYTSQQIATLVTNSFDSNYSCADLAAICNLHYKYGNTSNEFNSFAQLYKYENKDVEPHTFNLPSEFKKDICEEGFLKSDFSTNPNNLFGLELLATFAIRHNKECALKEIYIINCPNIWILTPQDNLIPKIIKHCSFLERFTLQNAFIPTLFTGTLANPLPRAGCRIDLQKNQIHEVQEGAIASWRRGELLLNKNPLTQQAAEQLEKDLAKSLRFKITEINDIAALAVKIGLQLSIGGTALTAALSYNKSGQTFLNHIASKDIILGVRPVKQPGMLILLTTQTLLMSLFRKHLFFDNVMNQTLSNWLVHTPTQIYYDNPSNSN